ncbi:MAG: hypothetical protein JWP12_1394 [Bacteroidetes bacterium]|nr:hypothetical protein [Bacteroidota bacterium]
MNNIILIDDREDFVIQFVEYAKSKNMSIAHKKSFSGLKEILPLHHHNFAAVILDIRCLLVNEQEKEDADFITVALSYLDRTIPLFPRFILTGDDKEFETIGRYFKQEKVFKKTPEDLEKLFVDLKNCADNSEPLRIKRENAQVFELFTLGKMAATAEEQLLALLKDGLTEKRISEFRGILTNVRSLQEIMYKCIHNRAPLVVPSHVFKPNGMIEFNKLMAHLNGNPDRNRGHVTTTTVYQVQPIYNLANSLYWVCSEYVHGTASRDYQISDYTIKSLINNLMELLLWSKQF